MIIKMRYEDKFQEVEVDAMDAGKWVNIDIDDCESVEEFEKRIQEQVDEQYNKPEYNIYHRETRHLGNAMYRNKDGSVEVNTDEALIRKAADDSIFTKDMDELEERMERVYQDKHYRDKIRSLLKPDVADMVIAIAIEGKTASEYAELINDDANNVSHRYRRAIKKLEKVFK